MDKVYAKATLQAAFERVKANGGGPGVDHVTIEMFEAHREENLTRLHESLRDGTYRPQPIRRAWIPKPGRREKRPLGIPTVRDRVVQAALRAVLEPIFERDFAESSYGFRPRRGTKDALRRVDALLKAGYVFVVDADLKSYFDTIPPALLMARVKTKVSDGRVLALLEAFLRQDVMEGLATWTPEQGTPQGAVISPLLSNIYLDPLDHVLADRGYELVRYADDFVVLCRTEEQARRALEEVKAWTASAGLALHPEKTRIVDATRRGGFDFLGYHFERGMHWPREKAIQNFRTRIRQLTRRTNGHAFAVIVADVNRVVRGWFEYFKHSQSNTFEFAVRRMRMRLRSILRRRSGRRGRGRGRDHQRWPNAFFQAHGLFSMDAAHTRLCHSSRR